MECPFVVTTTDEEIVLCEARPECQTGHDYLLVQLGEVAPYFLSPEDPLTTRIKGNLGEFVSFCVGQALAFASYQPFAVNAFDPLKNISSPEIDIVWLRFSTPPGDDSILLQEVKTTGDPRLTYVSRLTADYSKLFGTDPGLTLHTRLQKIKNVLEFSMGRSDLARRVSRLAGNSPATSPRVRLIPTAVHEKVASQPITKMLAIRDTLLGMGWGADAIQPWSISLTDLDTRMDRLSHGQN